MANKSSFKFTPEPKPKLELEPEKDKEIVSGTEEEKGEVSSEGQEPSAIAETQGEVQKEEEVIDHGMRKEGRQEEVTVTVTWCPNCHQIYTDKPQGTFLTCINCSKKIRVEGPVKS